MSGNIASVDEEPLRSGLRELVRKTVQETPNALLDEEADRMVGAERYERTAVRETCRSGHYKRKLVSTSGEVVLGALKLRGATLLRLRGRSRRARGSSPATSRLGYSWRWRRFFPRRNTSGTPPASTATRSARCRDKSRRESPRCSRPSMRRNRARRRRRRRPRRPTRSSR